MTPPLVELRNINFAYSPGSPVNRDLNFVLESGGRVGVMGANGVGKTTLFHLIVGLLKPSSGEVLVAGKPRRREQDFWEVRRRVGLLFQDPDDQLFCPTVGEDVAFGPLNLGHSHERVREIVKGTLTMLGLQHLEHRVTHHLSGGEKRLVSLAAVLAMEPEALLLDEPTAGLAEGMVDRVVEIINQRVPTCAIISHNGAFLDRCTDRRAEMRDGRIEPV
jgi:cobalt/nickel transport system ATP-binding protein